jgi:hypothetical protein
MRCRLSRARRDCSSVDAFGEHGASESRDYPKDATDIVDTSRQQVILVTELTSKDAREAPRRTFAELLINCEEDRTLRGVLVGMLREAKR